jgi:hypothetical protein
LRGPATVPSTTLCRGRRHLVAPVAELLIADLDKLNDAVGQTQGFDREHISEMHLAAPRAIPSNSQMRPTDVDTAPNPAGPGCSSNAYGLISRFSEGIDITILYDDLGQGGSVEEL